MSVVLDRPSPIAVTAADGVVRTPPRPPGQRQDDYDARFDATTIFFDVIWWEQKLWLHGPPLREFGPFLDAAEFRLDGVPTTAERRRTDLNRAARIVLDCPQPPQVLTIAGTGPDGQTVELSAPVSVTDPTVFAGRRVLFTLSRDNDLSWIRDWARYYVANHGADAVLFYDNDSTRYTPLQVSNVLGSVPGIKVVRVVSWPFPYGPQGGVWAGDPAIPWDSDFCQIGAMANARYGWLPQAAGVVNADIDELVVARTDTRIFDRLTASPNGYLRYSGRWIEPILAGKPGSGPPRHADFWLYNERRARCGYKWSVIPSRISDDVQWTAHSLYGMPGQSDDEFELAHVRGVNDGWKVKRSVVERDPERHRVHLGLVRALQHAYPDQFDRERVQRMLQWAGEDAEERESADRTSEFSRAVLDRLAPDTVTRQWVWRSSTVVFECRLEDITIAFDAYVSAGRVEVTVVSRDPAGTNRLRAAVASSGAPAHGTRPHGVRLKRWIQSGGSLPTDRIAGEIAAMITGIVGALTAELAGTAAAGQG